MIYLKALTTGKNVLKNKLSLSRSTPSILLMKHSKCIYNLIIQMQVLSKTFFETLYSIKIFQVFFHFGSTGNIKKKSHYCHVYLKKKIPYDFADLESICCSNKIQVINEVNMFVVARMKNILSNFCLFF